MNASEFIETIEAQREVSFPCGFGTCTRELRSVEARRLHRAHSHGVIPQAQELIVMRTPPVEPTRCTLCHLPLETHQFSQLWDHATDAARVDAEESYQRVGGWAGLQARRDALIDSLSPGKITV